jgi:hypothetical protein
LHSSFFNSFIAFISSSFVHRIHLSSIRLSHSSLLQSFIMDVEASDQRLWRKPFPTGFGGSYWLPVRSTTHSCAPYDFVDDYHVRVRRTFHDKAFKEMCRFFGGCPGLQTLPDRVYVIIERFK